MPLIVLVVALLVDTVTASLQRPGIAGRSCHSMTAVPGLGVVVYGGTRFCGTELIADSTFWSWNGRTWEALPGAFPGRREDALLVFDSRRRVLVLHGGRAGGQVYTDTWEWNGASWARRSDGASGAPGPLEHAAAAFDSVRGRVVVFGGATRDGKFNDATWEWDGVRWERHSTTGPPARIGPAMAGGGNGVYLYGGFNQAGSFTDLWRWNGARWERVHAAGPTHTEAIALVNTETGLLVIGAGTGLTQPGQSALRLWRFAAGTWSELPGSGPVLLVGQGAAWDAARRVLVLFGGGLPDGLPSATVWEFDGTGWRRP